jgi:hypothetical protein
VRRRLTDDELRRELRHARSENAKLRQKIARLENPPRPTVVCVDDVDLAVKAAGGKGFPRMRFVVGRDPKLKD